MSSWAAVPLAQLLIQITPDRVMPDAEDLVRFAGVRWYGGGLFVRETRKGSEVKGRCFALRPGLLTYNRLFAWKQSFAVVTDEYDGVVVSNEFPQFEVDAAQATADFVALYCSSPIFAVKALGMSTGSAAVSRNRLKEQDFLRLEISCPPLDVQQRILEVMSAVDSVIDALQIELEAVGAVRDAVLDELLRRKDDSWAEKTLGELGSITRGKRFTKSDYVDAGIGCIHYAQIHTEYGALTEQVRSWLPEQMRSRLRFAQPGDLVMAGTSENLEGVLKAVAWLGDETVAIHDDAFIFDHELEPRFASYVLASTPFRAQLPAVVSNTKVVRVSKEDLRRLSVPVPPLGVQASIADTVETVDRHVNATADELSRAKKARAALLDAMLTRKVDVAPQSANADE